LELGNTELPEETRMMGYLAEKKFDDIFSRLDTIHQCDRQTNKHRLTVIQHYT